MTLALVVQRYACSPKNFNASRDLTAHLDKLI